MAGTAKDSSLASLRGALVQLSPGGMLIASASPCGRSAVTSIWSLADATRNTRSKDPILGIPGPLGDQYLYAHTQFDVQGSYRLYKGLEFVASGLNLSNEVFGFYTGSPIYPNQREYYHPTLILGFRWVSAVER